MERNTFDSIKIGLASPEMIRQWSHGEVTKSETINYRTQRPERDGLFCERIFGPTKDYECYCGRYRRSNGTTKNKRCEKCGVVLTRKKVRREWMGHIELACPVAHIWYSHHTPSRMATLLDISPKQLDKVIYYQAYIVTDPGDVNETGLTKGQVLEDKEYQAKYLRFRDRFKAGMGAEAVKPLLQEMDLDALSADLKKQLEASNGQGQKKTHLIKRLEVVEAFRRSGNKPEWMILDVVPIMPPDLRTMVQLDGGRYATSDLNELYRKVIYVNNRLKKYLNTFSPKVIVNNEKRQLQDAVDALIDNGKHGRAITGSNNRTLKSLSEQLRGKQGRFRQNLLGKRVDYSGRSVIVVGPSLKIYQCGLPKEMALELFKPFVMKRLVETGKANNIKEAKKAVERVRNDVWDALEIVIKEHPVLLNRAPTLHRLSVQAFEPVLVEGRAIKLHPLVCKAFNADFDGDQMPVHVPLSVEAQAEARFLMLSANNLLKPADGKAVTVPSQDMVLGSYYLTISKSGEPGERPEGEELAFRDFNEAQMAYFNGIIGLHTPIRVRITKEIDGKEQSGIIRCTLGRLIFNQAIPQDLHYVDRTDPAKTFDLEIDFGNPGQSELGCGSKMLGQIIDRCIKYNGFAETTVMLDKIKAMGFEYSTKASLSISVADMVIPPEKKSFVEQAEKDVNAIAVAFGRGQINEDERYKNVIARWEKATDDVVDALDHCLSPFNPIKLMADSGARGSKKQMRQLSGIRGLMFATNGRTMEIPIKSNFREGLNILEYFMAARGARKSLSDTALKTSNSGYLTRRLVDVAHEVIIYEEDCGTTDGLTVHNIYENAKKEKYTESIAERLSGRYIATDVIDPETGKLIARANTMIDEATANQIAALPGVDSLGIKIRSPLKCRCKRGICAHCYGADLAHAKPVEVGEAVGVIAAQSIGEPGTQLTMRTFHTGGVAGSDITQGLPRVEELFEARTPKKPAVASDYPGTISISEAGKTHNIQVHRDDGQPDGKPYQIPYGIHITVAEGDHVDACQEMTEGYLVPEDILRINGIDAVYDYILQEVQKVYRAQNIEINDKHIEIITRQMTRKVHIDDAGDSSLQAGTDIFKPQLYDAIEEVQARIDAGEEGLKFPEYTPILLGIKKAALQTESFLSAASFQETTKVLTDAAINGKIDYLHGLKENVIIGKLIPAGTGMEQYSTLEVRNVNARPDPLMDELESAVGRISVHTPVSDDLDDDDFDTSDELTSVTDDEIIRDMSVVDEDSDPIFGTDDSTPLEDDDQ